MKLAELKTKSESELKDYIVVLRKELFKSRFLKAAQQLESTARVRAARRDIARAKTLLTQLKAPRAGHVSHQ